MQQEIERQANTRRILEEIAQGDVGDDILTPLMLENQFDVEKCVEVLLDMINEGRQSSQLNQSVTRLQEERRYFEECKKQAETRIAEELRRKDEVSKRLAEVEEDNRRQLSQMRRDLEAEWQRRLEDQQKEVLEKQRQLEEQRDKVMKEQLEKVRGRTKDPEVMDQVEQVLKQRMLEQNKREAQEIAGVTNNNNNNNSNNNNSFIMSPFASPTVRPLEAKINDVVNSSNNNNSNSTNNNSVTIELTAPPTAEVGTPITVYWEYKNGLPSMSDWIGYYKRSRPLDSNSYYVYQKTGGKEKGKLEFTVPSKLGICEVRMFQNNGYKMIARSNPIRVGNEVTLTAKIENNNNNNNINNNNNNNNSINNNNVTNTITCHVHYTDKAKQHSSWDWVAVFAENEEDNRHYVEGLFSYVTKDIVTLSAPRRPGRYVVRYFQSGSGYSELAQSQVLVVDDRDEVRIVSEKVERGQFVDVSWCIESVDASSKDYVALYRCEEGALFNPLVALGRQLTHCNQSHGVMKFCISSGVAPGTYELAFFSAKSGGKPVKKSAPFQVLDVKK